MKIRPLHDRLLVERLEEKEVKQGGIIIPDTAKEKPQEGKVKAVGNGKVGDDGKKIPLDVKAGDKILFGKLSFAISESAAWSRGWPTAPPSVSGGHAGSGPPRVRAL